MAYVDIDQEDNSDTNKNYVSPTLLVMLWNQLTDRFKYRYPKASIYTQMVTKTCTTTLRVPTTIWKTQKFSITTTLMKAHTTTVQRPTTIWKTQKFSITTTLTKALTVTVLRPTTVTEAKTHVELEAETVFEA